MHSVPLTPCFIAPTSAPGALFCLGACRDPCCIFLVSYIKCLQGPKQVLFLFLLKT